MTNKELGKIKEVFMENYPEVFNVTIERNVTVVVLKNGFSGTAMRKPGDINKPYKAMKLALARAYEDTALSEL